MKEIENHITVTIYGKALPMFGENDQARTLTLLNLLSEAVDVKEIKGVTDDEGTYIASFKSVTPMETLTKKALQALEKQTVELKNNIHVMNTWRADIFHENEADIAYDLEDPQYFQSEDDWNWGIKPQLS